MRRKRITVALGAFVALASLGAFASGELRRVATIDVGESQPKPVAYVLSDQVYTVPFEFAPTYEQWDQCERVDPNARFWGYNSSEQAFTITWGTPLDNWLILPGIRMQAGDFKFSCEYKTNYMAEDFSVCLLTAPDVEKVSRTLLDKKGEVSQTYKAYETTFSVPSDGVYYLALHATTNDGFGIYMRNFKVSSASTTMPAAPFITSYTMNGLEGTFNVELPSKTAGGTALTGNVNLDMRVDGEVVKTVAGAAGSVQSIDYTFLTGEHVVSFVAWLQNGDKKEMSEPVSQNVVAHALAPEVMKIPFTITPTEDESLWCTVQNMNNDAQTWTYQASALGSQAFVYRWDSGNMADDWLILPVIGFDEPGMYELTFDVATDNRTEKLEVSLADNTGALIANDSKIAVYDNLSTREKWESRSIRLSIKAKGNRYLAFHAASRQNQGRIYLRNISMQRGEDNTPLLPTISEIKMDGGDGTIAAVMPLTSYSGNEITGEITAHFSIDGGADQTVVSAAGQTAVLNVTGLARGRHTVTVYASVDDGGFTLNSESVSSEFTVSNPLSFRYTLPVSINLADSFLDLTVLDANEDGFTWHVADGALEYPYCALNQADDWVFTRPVTVTDENLDHILRMAIDAKTAYNAADSFEIWVGSAANPSDMTRKVLEVTEVHSKDYVNFANEFALNATGDYVIGIHAVSPGHSSYLYLQNLTFATTSRSSAVPGEADNVYAEGDQTGALKATVYFTFPTKDARGRDLDPDATLVLTASCNGHTATASGKPGEDSSVEIETAEGDNLVTLFCSNSYGPGLTFETTVKCGLDIPTTPRILSTEVSEDNYSVNIRWRAVTTGENEGIVNPAAMRYRVYTYYYDANQETEVWTEIEDTDKLNYTYSVPATTDYMESIGFGVEAYNAPGSVSPDRARTSAVLGKPYRLPMDETFADKELHYGPVSLFSTLQGRYQPEWYLGDPSELNAAAATSDGCALIGHTPYSTGDTQVELPKFATEMTSDREGYDVTGFTVTLRIFLYENTPSMKFVGLCAGAENSPVEIGELDTSLGTGWVDVTYTLPAELNGKQWVAFRNMVDFTAGASSWALIDGYTIRKTETNGVDAVTSGRSVTASTGAVTLRGFAGTEVSVADMSGKVIAARTVASDQWSIALPAGIYVVSTCDGAHKVIVK